MATPFNADSNETLWLVIAIVFIVLFATSLAVNIFLWIVRRNNLLKLQEELQKRQNDIHPIGAYGDTKISYL